MSATFYLLHKNKKRNNMIFVQFVHQYCFLNLLFNYFQSFLNAINAKFLTIKFIKLVYFLFALIADMYSLILKWTMFSKARVCRNSTVTTFISCYGHYFLHFQKQILLITPLIMPFVSSLSSSITITPYPNY